ncbi:lipopolysaccharide biosynthesis protein [Hydrotalea sp.]|uniref:lipopolysaccharide biosynthesis protein n=1 Tax=Hydrotalea sp. TaxID=2881279 RepID=UPI003D0DB12B
MSSIKKLAGQTMWYGASSIAARFINYLLTPLLTYGLAKTSDYGKMGLIYAAIPILNVVFTYGFETAYFRFSSKEENKNIIYDTAALSLFFSTIVFSILLWLNQSAFGAFTGLTNFPEIIRLSIIVISLDALSTIPFAKLRQEERPLKFAFVKIAGILLNIFITWFFIVYCPKQLQQPKGSWVVLVFNTETNPIVYVVFANVVQSAVTLLLLWKEIAKIQLKFNARLWKQMMIYSLPLVIAGMGGMINETFDRLMLRWWLPGSETFREEQVGIYNACYKLSILITLFIQAFRMGAEPFFFKQAESNNPQKVYARVMKFFVMIISIMFLVVALYLPVWKHFIGPKYWSGLKVVPILLFANMFLGIYYNLSIWYKITNKTMAGAWVTLAGAAITIIINYVFIPYFSFMACAWATFTCYGSMMVISYVWGQKVYRIPYAWKKLIAYMVIAFLLFFVHHTITAYITHYAFSYILATLLLLLFIGFLLKIERKEMQKLPFVGKYLA